MRQSSNKYLFKLSIFVCCIFVLFAQSTNAQSQPRKKNLQKLSQKDSKTKPNRFFIRGHYSIGASSPTTFKTALSTQLDALQSGTVFPTLYGLDFGYRITKDISLGVSGSLISFSGGYIGITSESTGKPEYDFTYGVSGLAIGAFGSYTFYQGKRLSAGAELSGGLIMGLKPKFTSGTTDVTNTASLSFPYFSGQLLTEYKITKSLSAGLMGGYFLASTTTAFDYKTNITGTETTLSVAGVSLTHPFLRLFVKIGF